MKKYIISDNRMFSMENDDFSTLKTKRPNYLIDYSWVIKEDGEIYYEGNTYPVVAGDVAFLLYADYKKDGINRELAIVHSDKFIEVLNKNNEYESERKKKSLSNDCEGDCECCEKCSSN